MYIFFTAVVFQSWITVEQINKGCNNRLFSLQSRLLSDFGSIFFKSKNVNKWQIAVTVYFVYLADGFLQSNLHKMRSTMRIQTKKKKQIRVG